MWFRPAKAVYVTEGLRAVFALRSRDEVIGWIPTSFGLAALPADRSIVNAWCLMQRHKDVEAVQDVIRSGDGLTIVNAMPMPDDQASVPGLVWKPETRMHLDAAGAGMALEETVVVLGAGRHSVRCFTLDVRPDAIQRVIFSSAPEQRLNGDAIETVSRQAKGIAVATDNGWIVACAGPETSLELLHETPSVNLSIMRT